MFDDHVRLFYVNLCFSKDSGELETLALGTGIVLNYFLSDKVFGIDSTGGISYMNCVWPDDFEVSLEGDKTTITEFGTNLSDFGLLSLCFKNKILAHMDATTLAAPLVVYLLRIYLCWLFEFKILLKLECVL